MINKEIRDRLGIQPGWVSLQQLVDDHVEIYFVPPAPSESLMRSLTKYADPEFVLGLKWDEITKVT